MEVCNSKLQRGSIDSLNANKNYLFALVIDIPVLIRYVKNMLIFAAFSHNKIHQNIAWRERLFIFVRRCIMKRFHTVDVPQLTSIYIVKSSLKIMSFNFYINCKKKTNYLQMKRTHEGIPLSNIICALIGKKCPPFQLSNNTLTR